MTTLVCLSLIVLIFLLPFLNRYFGIWACNWMDWHLEPKAKQFDGCSEGGYCPRCSKYVLQDSQGNWFDIKGD